MNMIDKNTKSRIFDTVYQDNLREVVSHIVNYDDYKNALSLYRILRRAVTDNNQELSKQPTLGAFYKESLLSLAYICLPALDDKEVEHMLQHEIMFQFHLPNYNLIQKIDYKLINIIVVSERVIFKDRLRKALLENSETIVKNNEIKSVSDWLRDYVSKVGLDGKDKLASAQYLMSIKANKNIEEKDRDYLTVVFKLYEKLSLPSNTPEGFEEELPINFNGRLFVLRRGVLEPIEKNKDVDAALELLNKEPAQTKKDEKTIDKQPEQEILPSQPSNLSVLEEALKNYSESTLEHKAIKQEISRLKAGNLRQAQKSDVRETK